MGSPASDLDRFLKTDGLRILLASGAARIRSRGSPAGEKDTPGKNGPDTSGSSKPDTAAE